MSITIQGKGKVIGNSFLYTLSALFSKAMGFFLLPIYTRFLTTDDYGITNLVTSFIDVASFIVAFSLYSTITRFYTDFKNDQEKLKRFYGTIVTFVFCSGCAFTILGFVLQKFWVNWVFRGIPFFPIVAIAVVTIVFFCLQTVHQYIMQSMQDGKRYSISNVVLVSTTICFNLLFICVFKLGALGVVLATLVCSGLYLVYLLIDLLKRDLITFGIDKFLLKEALKYSMPIMPHNLFTRIGTWISKIILNNSGSLSFVGLYGVAAQFGVVIDAVQTAGYLAFMPWFNDMMNNQDEKSKKEIIDLSNILLLLYTIMYMVIGLFSQEVIILMVNESYIKAWVIIPIFVVAYAVKSIYYFYLCIMFYYKEAARKIFLVSGTGSLFSIVLSAFLIPSYGMYGAAFAFLISNIAMVTMMVIISKPYSHVGLNAIKMFKTVALSLMFMAIGLYYSYTKYLTEFSWFNILFKLIILAIYLIILFIRYKKFFAKYIYYNKIKRLIGRKI